MSLNGISELSTNGVADKEKRQKAKLDLAAAKRAADGNPRATYDITQLPTQWDFNTSTNENEIVDNPNTGGLILGRPWAAGSTPSPSPTLQFYLDASDPNSYPGTGSTWTDLSSNGYVATLIGSPTFNTTHFTFNGTAQYVDANQSLAAETFSVGCWFRTSAAGIKMLLSKETVSGNPWNYRIWMNGGSLNADISAYEPPGGNQPVQSLLTTTTTTYNNGEWYLVMFTRDDSNWYIYVNGVQVATKADNFTGTIVNSQELWIGRSAFTGQSPTGSYQYTGDIGHVFVYNTVLDSTEILQLYNDTKTVYGL